MVWFPFNTNFQEAKKIIFCFPHSGAGASTYYSWLTLAHPDTCICPVQLPGRESRFNEKPITSMQVLIDQLEKKIAPLTIGKKIAFFGHSLGGYIAFECANRFQNPNFCTFISANNAPGKRSGKKIHELPDKEFIQEIASYGGFAKALLNDQELLNLVLPTLRADITLLENYETANTASVPGMLCVFGGTEDSLVSQESLLHWKKYCKNDFISKLFSGDHFFYQKVSDKIVNVIQDCLS